MLPFDVTKSIRVPVTLYSPAGDVIGVAAGVGVPNEVCDTLGDGVIEGVDDGIGDGLAEGTANKLVPNTRNAPRTTAATAITPVIMSIFWFFALV